MEGEIGNGVGGGGGGGRGERNRILPRPCLKIAKPLNFATSEGKWYGSDELKCEDEWLHASLIHFETTLNALAAIKRINYRSEDGVSPSMELEAMFGIFLFRTEIRRGG